MLFPLVAEGLRNGLFFGVYGHLLDFIGSSSTGSRVAGDLRETSYSRIALAAGIAGCIQGVAATPVELVKVLLQSNKGTEDVQWTFP